MAKYTPLGDYLRSQEKPFVPMTFAEIERVIGDKLPPKAQYHRAWWSNNPSNSVMTKVWLEAGFETQQVDMRERKLVFRKVSARAESRHVASPPAPSSENCHSLLGLLKDVTIIIPNVDLTKPADPEWGERSEAWAKNWGRDK